MDPKHKPAGPSPEVAPKCDCHNHEHRVCDICQGVTGRETDAPPIVPAEQPVECPGCHGPIFVRGNGTIVAHYDRYGDKCKRNEAQYSPAVAPRETQTPRKFCECPIPSPSTEGTHCLDCWELLKVAKMAEKEPEALQCKWCGCSVYPFMTVTCFESPTGLCEVEPAAAPTPVEREEISEDDYYDGEPCPECGRPCLECDCSAAPAESQGVERAQPVEEPREPTCPECKVGLNSHDLGGNDRCFHCAMCGYVQCESKARERHDRKPSAAPVEGVERVTDDAPARVEPTHKKVPSGPVCAKAGLWPYPCHGRLELQKEGRMKGSFLCEEHAFQAQQPAAQPAKHTDDRPAETIPERYTQDFKDASGWHNGSYIQQIHRELGRSETRIEVLEAALRQAKQALEYAYESSRVAEAAMISDALTTIDAALAVPSGEQP